MLHKLHEAPGCINDLEVGAGHVEVATMDSQGQRQDLDWNGTSSLILAV